MEILAGFFRTGYNVNLNKPLRRKRILKQIEKLGLSVEEVYNLRIQNDNRTHCHRMVENCFCCFGTDSIRSLGSRKEA
jgi:hypothetical protein